MENKINIAELLKNCPKGMELYSPIFGELKFIEVNAINNNILVVQQNGYITEFESDGRLINCKNGECLLFPSKEKTTWEGFVPPCEFKDGDVVATTNGLWIGITTGGEKGKFIPTYCVIRSDDEFKAYPDRKETWQFHRLATEEEKAKLFQTIKDNGYKWNEETKTLEKLVNPRFKIGNRIKYKTNQYEYTIIDITKDNYIVRYKTDKFDYHVPFWDEDNYDLVLDKFDITALKPFDKVLMRSSNAREWVGTFYSHYSNNKFYGCGMCCDQCVPYEENQHLLGTTNDCEEYYKNW